ncbi:MAG: hypothetical protein KDA96_20325, partial [Planctomycetaceae bacterium]|nr:hypothetical protein [Planctomycetaceae bacterium]
LELSSQNIKTHYTVTVSYDTSEPVTEETGDGLRMTRRYYRIAPTDGRSDAAESQSRMLLRSPCVVTAGDVIEVELEITADDAAEYVLVEDHKPAGFEPLERNSGHIGFSAAYRWQRRPEQVYREFHHERVSFYLPYVSGQPKTLTYRMRAETPAVSVTALPASAVAMYAPEQSAMTRETVFRVDQ